MIFGLGSGRCGTMTLASLIDSQADALCFHEVNPAAMAWQGSEHAVYSIVRDFEATRVGVAGHWLELASWSGGRLGTTR